MTKFANVGERILLTLWVGGMWAIGFLAAPTLFATLDDRQLAGELAGKLFKLIHGIGLFAACALLVFMVIEHGRTILKFWRAWVVFTMAVFVAIGLFVLQPEMAALKQSGLAEGSEAAASFSRLHSASSGLYTLTCLLGLAIVAFPNRK